MKMKLWFAALVLCGTPLLVGAQDIIYRRNGDVLTVFDLSASGKGRSYRLQGDEPGMVRHISILAIDSIHYKDGFREIFQYPYDDIPMTEFEHPKSFHRNYLALDLSALLIYRNAGLMFEYLPGKGHTGFFVSFSKNLDPVTLLEYRYSYGESPDYEQSMLRYLSWNFRSGANFYLFPPGFFRMSAGLSWITGKYDFERYEYQEYEPFEKVVKGSNQTLHGLILSPVLHVQPGDFYQLRMGIDIPVITNRRFSHGLFRLEAVLNF